MKYDQECGKDKGQEKHWRNRVEIKEKNTAKGGSDVEKDEEL